MSKFTADEVEREAKIASECGDTKDAGMLRDLARRLRQEEEENRRDPVTDPRPGDMVRRPDKADCFYLDRETCTQSALVFAALCGKPGAIIIRRRKVQQ